MSIITKMLCASALSLSLVGVAGSALAEDITINVAGMAGQYENYRLDAIKMAADVLERESAIDGTDLKITVKTKDYNDWAAFKQAITLAAQSGTAPNIVVTGHEDIAPWSQSGIIAPIEDYIDLDSWPISAIYPNLLRIGAYGGVQYGIPQDAESRPMFFWKPYMKAIGYTDQQIEDLPKMVQEGKYTLQNVLEDARKMQDKGLIKPGYGFYPRVSNGPDYWQFYTSFGGKMQDDKTGKLVFDKAAMKKFYQFFADAVKDGVTRKNHIGTPWDQWYNEVATGKAGIWDGGTWHYANYTKTQGLKDFFGKIQFTLIPAGDANDGKANTLTHPLVYLITKQKDEQAMEVAAKLVEIASDPQINALHAIKSGHLGISPEEGKISFYSNDRWTREVTERLLPHANAMPNNTNFGTYWDIMWKGLEATWTGQKTADQAVSDDEAALKNSLGESIEIR